MSAEQITPGTRLAEFVVRPDGTVRGDDGDAGMLAASLPYAGRLARRVGELLGAGDLRRIETVGSARLSVGVTWTPAGEGTFRAVIDAAETRTLPNFMVVGGAETGAAVQHCVQRLAGRDDVGLGAIMSSDSRILGVAGDAGSHGEQLPEIGTRVLALLRSLEGDQDGFVRLGFETGTVVGAGLGRHCLFAMADPGGDDTLIAVVDEIRAVLDGHDLASVSAVSAVSGPVEVVDEPVAEPVQARPALPVGARYRGASGAKAGEPRRRLRGR
jgi:hypothetical protein